MLHPQLQQDCYILGRFALCYLLLARDANYPWVILVPDRENVSEIFELSEADQVQLLKESSRLSQVLAQEFSADKINVAALGNIVPQLHIHHLARYKNDPAWPGPVWGQVKPRAYEEDELKEVVSKLQQALAEDLVEVRHDYRN